MTQELHDVHMPEIANLGHLVDGEIVREGVPFVVEDPSTGSSLGACLGANGVLLDRAVQAAQHALADWAQNEELRLAALLLFATRLDSAAQAIGKVVAAEAGSLWGEWEVTTAADHVRWLATEALPRDVIIDTSDELVVVERAPVGVVAAILPWNVPVSMLVNKVALAMRVGNTIVAKPSPYTPFSALIIGELLADIVPPGTVNILAGTDDLGRAMVAHPGVDLIAFTGSVGTGQRIMAAAAPTLKRLVLELGGNDAAIVLADVDIARHAEALYASAFAMTGQVCAAVKRLYVHEDVYEEVQRALVQIAERERLGDARDPSTSFGPIANRNQLEYVQDLVRDAIESGGRVITGGAQADRDGHFFPPTIIVDVDESTRLVSEEQFGPVLPVISFRKLDQAIAAANNTRFGLGASVWTADIEQGAKVASQLQAGSVWVNRHGDVSPRIPFGGIKQSGVGREGGSAGIDAFSELKAVSINRS